MLVGPVCGWTTQSVSSARREVAIVQPVQPTESQQSEHGAKRRGTLKAPAPMQPAVEPDKDKPDAPAAGAVATAAGGGAATKPAAAGATLTAADDSDGGDAALPGAERGEEGDDDDFIDDGEEAEEAKERRRKRAAAAAARRKQQRGKDDGDGGATKRRRRSQWSEQEAAGAAAQEEQDEAVSGWGWGRDWVPGCSGDAVCVYLTSFPGLAGIAALFWKLKPIRSFRSWFPISVPWHALSRHSSHARSLVSAPASHPLPQAGERAQALLGAGLWEESAFLTARKVRLSDVCWPAERGTCSVSEQGQWAWACEDACVWCGVPCSHLPTDPATPCCQTRARARTLPTWPHTGRRPDAGAHQDRCRRRGRHRRRQHGPAPPRPPCQVRRRGLHPRLRPRLRRLH